MATTADDVWRLLAELTTAQKETDLQLKEVSQAQKETDRQQKETDRQLKELGKQTDRCRSLPMLPMRFKYWVLGRRIGSWCCIE
ncbi:MAG: hypothetical protein KA717_22335 [Woronichinia naegeliana WA131]|jgi:hypothetical protein|uniref:DUF3782 domain-containing protein n=1 Tax=Woronichinia naegeliana WA131 TaxID=2824559 RepID=A0A977PTG0_9CYAN|nr:MAG: hypothetical protein KA717_22335 [Woronichinia naegeliana WA131]